MIKKFPTRYQIIFLFALTLIAYANTFNHGYNLDDFLLSDNLPAVEEGWPGTVKIFTSAYNLFDYRPIAIFTYAIEQQLQGKLVPGTSHIVNAVLYFLCCLMLFFTLRRLPVNNAHWIALFATAIFIVHPIHSNVISSLKNRDTIMSLTFGLSSIFFALRFIQYEHDELRRSIAMKSLFLVVALLLFLISTMAKLDAVSFIILLPLTFFILSKNRMWLIYSSGLGFVAYKAFRYIRFQIITPRFLETTSVEESILPTENTMMLYDTLSVKVSTALISLFYYLKFHLIPKGYYYYFGFDMIPVDELFIWQNILAAAVALLSLIAFIYYFRKRPEISFGIGFFFGGLAYCLNLYTPIAGIVAPRLAFISSVGFCIILAAIVLGAGHFFHRKFLSKKMQLSTVRLILLGLVLAFYIPFTIDRNNDWKDIWTLIEADVPHLENSFEGQRIACMNYMEKSKVVGSNEEAVDLIEKSLIHCTLASSIFDEDLNVENTIGVAYYRLRNYQQSYEQFKKVVVNFEDTEAAHQYLGDLFLNNNRHDSAAYYFRGLIDIAPDYEVGYFKYNQSMVQLNRVDEAHRENLKFVRDNPDYYFIYDGLGYLTLIKGDTITATNIFFYSLDRGCPTYQYVEALKPYYENHGIMDTWDNFIRGHRMEIDLYQ